MALSVFPSLPGLGWSVTKSPKFSTRIQKAISGRELRVLDQLEPIWTWTLTYPILRDAHDTRGSGGLGVGYDELRTLAGFFLQMQGTFQPFLFNDPTDNIVAGQGIGVGDGVTTIWQLLRTFGGFSEPIVVPNSVSNIYLNGFVQSPSTYTVDLTTGIVTFEFAPTVGQSIVADFTYYFRVRFADDTAEFENFMYQLWELKQIKLQSVLA